MSRFVVQTRTVTNDPFSPPATLFVLMLSYRAQHRLRRTGDLLCPFLRYPSYCFLMLGDAVSVCALHPKTVRNRPGVLASARQQKKISARGRGRGRGRGRQQQQQQRQDGGGDVDGPMDADAAATAEEEGEGGVLGLLSERGQGWLAG